MSPKLVVPSPGAPRGAARPSGAALAVTLALVATLGSGCATTEPGRKVSGWFGASTEGTAMVATSPTDVRADAAPASAVVGRLAAGDPVTVHEKKGDLVRIEARAGHLKGWVPASRLAKGKPKAAKGAKAAFTAQATPDGQAATNGGEAAAEDAIDSANAPATDAGNEAAAPLKPGALEVSTDEPVAETPPPPAPKPAKPPKTVKPGVAPSVFDPY